MRAFFRVSADGAAGAGEVAGAAVGAAAGAPDGAGDSVDAGDGSDPCAAGAGGVPAGGIAGLLDALAGVCPRTGSKAARLVPRKMREIRSRCGMKSVSHIRRSMAPYYR